MTKDACYYEVSIRALLKENWVFDKTIYHHEFPFLRELWSIGKVNTGDKTTRELAVKGSSYTASSHWAALELPPAFPSG